MYLSSIGLLSNSLLRLKIVFNFSNLKSEEPCTDISIIPELNNEI